MSYAMVKKNLDAIQSAAQPTEPPPPPGSDALNPFLKRLEPQIKKGQKRIKEAQAKNAELLKIYNGHRVELGMTINEVDALFGAPNRTLALTNGMTARIYDSPNDRYQLGGDLYPGTKFSPIAVVFDSGKASRVFSNGFFPRSWAIKPDPP